MQIGSINLGNRPLLLAPMEDVTDPSFRFLCKHFGADMVFTEFISSDGLLHEGRKSVEKLNISESERPIGIQIYGHIPESMMEAALIAEAANPDTIDINFGCPVKKIANRGAGSGMMRYPELMADITARVVQAVKKPVTVKTRLGWDENSKNIVEIALRLQDAGIQALTIHGRTRSQMYKGEADWTLIGEVKNHPAIHIPIIGNGDIHDGPSAKAAFETYGVDGIMIGRASVGHPRIFAEIKHYLEHGTVLPPLSLLETVELATLHFTKSLEYKKLPRAIFEMRRHFCTYFKGIPDFKETRMKLVTATNPDEIFALLQYIGQRFGEGR